MLVIPKKVDIAPELVTERLRLRRWVESDAAPFAEMNADPEVMEYFLGTLSRQESDAMIVRINRQFEECGFGLWAVELRESGEFIGFIGLSAQSFLAQLVPVASDPPIEVGWRLRRSAWGHGYATEGGRAAVAAGLAAGIPEIVSMTSEINLRSRAVMERIGLVRVPADDFDHPRIPAGHRLARHVLYRTTPHTAD